MRVERADEAAHHVDAARVAHRFNLVEQAHAAERVLLVATFEVRLEGIKS